MKIGIIIPTRGDRPALLLNCIKLIQKQTLQPVEIQLVDYIPKSKETDITQRYKFGYDALRNKGLDIIALMEDDDWYSSTYLETMVNKWIASGKPDLLGTNYTIYYHIKEFAHFTMYHESRSSAMSTLIKPDLNFKWCPDHEPYTDIHLWSTLKGVIFKPETHICMGIKHGIGLCGGRSHIDRLHRYINKDADKSFLKSIVDPDSYLLYNEILSH